jgi:hypothetical protein
LRDFWLRFGIVSKLPLHSTCTKIAALFSALRFLASPQHNQVNLLLRSACAKIATIIS